MADGGNSIWSGLAGTDHLRTAEEAFKLIESVTGKPFSIKISGFRMLVLLQVQPEVTSGGIIMTASYRDNDPRRARCALVLQQGEECYTGSINGVERFPKGPYCKVGDWIMFDRYDATASLFRYCNKFAMGTVIDEKIGGVASIGDKGSPKDVVAIRMEDLF